MQTSQPPSPKLPILLCSLQCTCSTLTSLKYHPADMVNKLSTLTVQDSLFTYNDILCSFVCLYWSRTKMGFLLPWKYGFYWYQTFCPRLITGSEVPAGGQDLLRQMVYIILWYRYIFVKEVALKIWVCVLSGNVQMWHISYEESLSFGSSAYESQPDFDSQSW